MDELVNVVGEVVDKLGGLMRITVGAWVRVEMEGERSLSGGDALLMASALRVVIQQQAAGPCASCLLNQAESSGDGGAGAGAADWAAKRGECDLAQTVGAPRAATPARAPVALARQLISRTTTRPRRPYKLSPPPTTSKQSIVSTLHAHRTPNAHLQLPAPLSPNFTKPPKPPSK